MSKGTQENEIRANLRANIEVVANRSRYTSTDYFPDNNEIPQDILTSLKSTRSYFSILVGMNFNTYMGTYLLLLNGKSNCISS